MELLHAGIRVRRPIPIPIRAGPLVAVAADPGPERLRAPVNPRHNSAPLSGRR